MGLTIHYSLRSETESAAEARRLIEALRQRALDLPFASVGDVLEFRNEQCDPHAHEHPRHRRLLTQAVSTIFPGGAMQDVVPEHVIAFTTDPGDGSEPANFGLCRYPPEIVDRDSKTIETELPRWGWESFCKTQYASNPDCGGMENFLRCHLPVVGVLDQAARLGLLSEVTDESGFFDDRDVEGLAAEVMRWNRGLAAFTGTLIDIFGRDFASEITSFPNFERLEAEGRREEE